jgi:RNA polymerase-binding transcription factor DksA
MSTKSSLPPPPSPPADIPLRWIWHYSTLRALRERLRGEISQHALEAMEPCREAGADLVDGARAEFDHDAALAVLGPEEHALVEVEAAIERIHRGTYGTCEGTGRRIPSGRLRVLPWCRYTVEEQAAREAGRRPPRGPGGGR